MLAKAIVATIFIGILASLGSGLFYLMKDKSQSDRAVKALTLRVLMSIGLLTLLVLLSWAGLITPHGVRP